MEFKFDAEQEYQIAAIDAITGLLEGQSRNELDLTFALSGIAAVPNKLDLSEEALLHNLQTVQEQNGIGRDTALQYIGERIQTAEGELSVRFPNFSVTTQVD